MQSSNNLEFGRLFVASLAEAIVEGRKQAPATRSVQGDANKQAQADAEKPAQNADAPPSTEATLNVVAAPTAADKHETTFFSNVPPATSTATNSGTAAALPEPKKSPIIQQTVTWVGKTTGTALLAALVKWANGVGGSGDAHEFAAHLDLARVNLHCLNARDAETLLQRLMRYKSNALVGATTEQRQFVQTKWDACIVAYEKRRAQLTEQQSVPEEPSSSVCAGASINAAQAAAILQILTKTPYCDVRTHKVIQRPESTKALLEAYQRAGGSQMTRAQTTSVRKAMRYVELSQQPLSATHLQTEKV